MNKKIEKWFYARGLNNQDPFKQLAKFLEEAGELANALCKDKDYEGQDAIGDVVVTLIGICVQKGWNFDKCIEQAYNEIKDREGVLINGIFVKSSDM